MTPSRADTFGQPPLAATRADDLEQNAAPESALERRAARGNLADETHPPLKRRSRHIQAAVRRAVWKRDEARCAYMDCDGQRCRETCGLEVHHRVAHALGGPATVSNLELRCRAHNLLAAEEDFGRDHMDRLRGCDTAPPP